MTADPKRLRAGYAQPMRGRAQYSGVLRRTPSLTSWTCVHDHVTAHSAKRCAEAELTRRLEGAREVFTLLWCGPCRQWWTPDQAGPPGRCLRCDVPAESVKLVVLERSRVS